MLQQFKQIDKNKIILFLSQIINAFIGICIGKIIAIYFLPEEFGAYNILLATYTFFFTLILNPYLQYVKTFTNSNILKEDFDSHFKFSFVLNVLAALLLFITLLFLKSFNLYIFGILLLVFPANFTYNLLLDFFNVKGELHFFTKLSLVFSLVNLLVLLLGVFLFKHQFDSLILLWGIQLVAYFFAVIFFIGKYPFVKISDWKLIKLGYLKDYLVYAWPLIILAFWNWINSYFDRYLIEYFLDIKKVGLYNANFSLGTKVFLMINPFFLAILTPVVFNSDIEYEIKKRQIIKYARFYVIIGFVILLMLYFLNDFIGHILLSLNYKKGFYIIFWSALAYFLITFGYLFELIFYYKKNTKVILLANLVSALVSIVLNIILIPKLGLNGVLLSLVVSACIRLIVILRKYHKTV